MSFRKNETAAAAEPVIVLGVGAIVVLLLFGLLAAVVLTALLIWLLPFLIVIYGIYLMSQNKTTAGMAAIGVGLLIFVVAAIL